MTKIGSKRKPSSRRNAPSIEICILAGGSSERMGRDKSRLRFGQTTMLGQIRRTARATGLPVSIIRRDCISKCGPLGGIYTALKATRGDAVLFLACDMPLVTTELIQFVLRHTTEALGNANAPNRGPLFVGPGGRPGFPFVLRRENLQSVHKQIQKGEFSLQTLANAIKATIVPVKRRWTRLLFNVNTPREWTALKHMECAPHEGRKPKR